jgi:signal transduction histidine kinase
VRVRTTTAAVIVVGVALVVAALVMVQLVSRSLSEDVRLSALARARNAARALAAGEQIVGIPLGKEDEEFVQVLDAAGRVTQSSTNLAGRAPVVALAPGQTGRIGGVPALGNDDPFLAVAISVQTPTGPATVIVGRSLASVTDAIRILTRILIGGLPLVLLIVGVVIWRMVGRALSPVEEMRREAEAISTRDLHRRVPDPPGRDEIAGLAKTMNRMLARLERGQLRQRRLVSDASHELRSPLATIRQYAEVALAHPEATNVQELAGVVLEEQIRLQRLVEDLLLLAKLEEGTEPQRAEAVDLDDLAFEEARRLKAVAGLQVDVTGVAPGRVWGDRTQLERLLRNLVDNAARHARTRIALGLQENGGGVLLTVDDDGEGIPPADRDRIFGRFVRLDDARSRDSGGSGLGLAIVAEIAAAHGATIAVGDAPEGGSRFTVRFITGEPGGSGG